MRTNYIGTYNIDRHNEIDIYTLNVSLFLLTNILVGIMLSFIKLFGVCLFVVVVDDDNDVDVDVDFDGWNILNHEERERSVIVL